MIFSARMHDDDEIAGDEELNDLDDLDASLDDSVLDELAEEEEVEEDDATMGFGHIAEDIDEEEEEEEEAEHDEEPLPEEDAEDVDFDTFDDIDEM